MAGKKVYDQIVEELYRRHRSPGMRQFDFDRSELEQIPVDLGIPVPKNLGDIVYHYRFRSELPSSITKTAESGQEWRIDGTGKGRYRFLQAGICNIVPRAGVRAIKIPDATPEIIAHHALNDEQALLARIRYNRLVDIFLGATTYSLQNHLRTTVKDVGQIEVDELYVGVNRFGDQYIIPVQAKHLKDKAGATQALQDIAFCSAQFPELLCRPIAAQFMANGTIAMMELAEDHGDVKVVDEKHYTLVPAEDVTATDLKAYRARR